MNTNRTTFGNGKGTDSLMDKIARLVAENRALVTENNLLRERIRGMHAAIGKEQE